MLIIARRLDEDIVIFDQQQKEVARVRVVGVSKGAAGGRVTLALAGDMQFCRLETALARGVILADVPPPIPRAKQRHHLRSPRA